MDAHVLKLVGSLPIVYLSASMLEALWRPLELLRFVLFSTGVSGFFALGVVYILQIIEGQSRTPHLSGCIGLVITLVIGFRHAFPYKQVLNLNRYFPPILHELLPARGLVQSRHLPFLILCSALALGWFFPFYFPDWVFALPSFFASWFFIRYLMNFPYANVRGDHSSEFNFSLLFPKVLRPWIDRVSEVVYLFACRVTGGWVELRVTDKVSLAVASSMYSPSDSAAASAVIEGFSETSEEHKAKFEERRMKALQFLDANIAALMGRTDEADRLVEKQRELGLVTAEELAQV